MNSTWIILFILFFVIATQENTIRTIISSQKMKHQLKKKGKFIMTQEMMDRIIGKEVYIFSISTNNGNVRGVVEKIEDGWIELRTKAGQQQYVNIDYVSGILEQKVKNK